MGGGGGGEGITDFPPKLISSVSAKSVTDQKRTGSVLLRVVICSVRMGGGGGGGGGDHCLIGCRKPEKSNY